MKQQIEIEENSWEWDVVPPGQTTQKQDDEDDGIVAGTSISACALVSFMGFSGIAVLCFGAITTILNN